MIPVPRKTLAALASAYGIAADAVTHFARGGPEGDGVILPTHTAANGACSR